MSTAPHADQHARIIHIESIFGAHTGEPLVGLQWGDQTCQLTPDEARAHALRILECAEAADQDAYLMDFLLHKVSVLELEKLVFVLKDFRAWRDARQPKGT